MNILIGGKLGDFIHSLIIPKYLYDRSGEKFNIYICNHEQETFGNGIEQTYAELESTIKQQQYVNDFAIYSGQIIDIDLTRFRDYTNLLSTSWNEFYLWNYISPQIEIPFNYTWLDIKKDEKYKDMLLINRSNLPYDNPDAEKFYRNYIKGYKGRVFFVCSWEWQYESFFLKNELPMMLIPELKDMIAALASCEHFLGNMTGTTAIANAFNTPRTIETFKNPDKFKYILEMPYYNKLTCF